MVGRNRFKELSTRTTDQHATPSGSAITPRRPQSIQGAVDSDNRSARNAQRQRDNAADPRKRRVRYGRCAVIRFRPAVGLTDFTLFGPEECPLYSAPGQAHKIAGIELELESHTAVVGGGGGAGPAALLGHPARSRRGESRQRRCARPEGGFDGFRPRRAQEPDAPTLVLWRLAWPHSALHGWQSRFVLRVLPELREWAVKDSNLQPSGSPPISGGASA
jgi:hypothetical protein